MANKARRNNVLNHKRQIEYLRKGVIMLPTLIEERRKKK